MKAWQTLVVVSLIVIAVTSALLLRRNLSSRATPAAQASQSSSVTLTSVFAGGDSAGDDSDVKTHDDLSSFDIVEGKRLYKWFNCNTCHANGGGDIGPPLMDDKWLYGSESKNIFASIVEGRPNGMPSFRNRIPDAQVWQLVAYVRSMAGLVPSAFRSSRNDDMAAKPAENLKEKQSPTPGGGPPADSRSTTK